MSAPRNVNRCTPCLNSHHARCTGSAGNVGCGCIHAAPAPLDPGKVRDVLTTLEREREVQQAIVTYLDDALDGAERTLTSIDRRLAALRAEPAVIAALAAQEPRERCDRLDCRARGCIASGPTPPCGGAPS